MKKANNFDPEAFFFFVVKASYASLWSAHPPACA
jgi:hypothetical protein